MDVSKKFDNPNPRASANPLSKLIFGWLFSLFWYGKNHDLEMKNIYNIMPDDVSEPLGNKLEQNWKNEVLAAEKSGRKPKFFMALRKTFIWSFLYYGGWYLFLCTVLRVFQPYVLGLLIWHFDPRATSTQTEAYLYASGVIIAAILMAFITHHSQLGLLEIGMRMRIASSSLMYRKILRLSKSSTITSPGQIVNLLSNDMSRFDQLFIMLHYIWIMPIQGAIIAFLIWQNVGVASLAGVFLITIQTIPVQGYISKWTSKLRLKIAVRTDERIRLMSEIINGIQVIKMYTWEKPFQELVSRARKYEVDVLTLTSYLRGFTLATFVFTERTTLYFTIMAYVLTGHSISADKVFSMAQYFNILQATMAIFYPIAVASAAEAAVSIKRIENFLLLDENVPSAHPLLSNKEASIAMKGVSASWTNSAIVNTLHNINIQIEAGKLYAVVGAVGAGKSSFLQAILGELRPSYGQIHVNGKISYASQEAWLFASSVRNNILFGQIYKKDKYQKVVKVCALTKDFEQLPYGDKTLVGDRGTALSGGQRARINLARAVYKNSDIYLLDDPLSAVDTHVGRHLFDECISDYLRDKTRILVTHQLQYLKQCDYIIILNNGQIEDEGTFAGLQEKHANFLEILTQKETNTEVMETAEVDLNPTPEVTSNGTVDEDAEEEEPQETEELLAKGSMSKSVYWKYLRSGGSIIAIITFLLLTIVGQIGSSGCDYWVGYWTKQEELHIKAIRERHKSLNDSFAISSASRSSKQINNMSQLYNELGDFSTTTTMQTNYSIDDTDGTLLQNLTSVNATKIIDTDTYYYLDTTLWIYGMFIVVSIVMTTLRNLVFYRICMNASKNLHNFMFSCLLKAPMSFFDNNPAGRILNRFSKDIGAVDESMPKAMIEAIQIFAVMIGILVQILIINWWIIFAVIIMGFLFGMVRNVYVPTAQQLKRLEGNAKSPIFSHVNSTLSGLTTIRSADAQEMVRKQFDEHQNLHTSTYSLSVVTGVAFGFTLDIVSVCFVAVVTYSFIALNDGNTFAGNVGLAISQVLILCGMLQYGMRQTTETITQMTSVERILQFTELEKEGPFESNSADKPSSNWPSKGEIKFDRVFLRYSESNSPVLKSLSFVIEPGMKIGIVGRTGAGKSSLISALFYMAKLDGAIYIDNVNTKKIGLHDLRNKISIIPQEPVLFSATLRENLDPFNKFNDADLWAALAEVELKESSSLDYCVQQGGSNFSVGQRQLICLARAILQDNKILVLDEATANVDPTTDMLIQNTIRKKFKACTVLTIAHRLNTIMDNDKVLVMDHGRAIEFDHPYILLQNDRGHFSNMVQESGKPMAKQLRQHAQKAYEQQHGFT